MARVNDALRDIFQAFVLSSPPHLLGEAGVMVAPVLRPGASTRWSPRLERAAAEEPPLRALHASQPSANAQESWHSDH